MSVRSGVHRSLVACFVVCASLALAERVSARAFVQAGGATSAPADPIVAARAALVVKLVDIAKWCGSVGLQLSARETYEAILRYEPDHAEARKALKYTRAKDGTWQGGPKGAVKNGNAKELANLAKKRADAAAGYRDTLLASLDNAQAKPGERNKVYDELLALDPNDPKVHELKGYMRDGERWVLADAVKGKARRAELEKLAQSCLAAASTGEVGAPDEYDSKLRASWKLVLTTPRVRVLAASDEIEARATLKNIEGCAELVKSLFQVEPKLPKDVVVYLVPPAEKDAFIANVPTLSDEERQSLRTMFGHSLGNTNRIAVWDTDPEKRRDVIVRHVLAQLLRETFKVYPQGGWTYEGFGTYLNQLVTGGKRIWFIPGSAYKGSEAQNLFDKLAKPDSNWYAAAHEVLSAPNKPTLEALLRRQMGSMTMAEMVAVHALVAYLLETQQIGIVKHVLEMSADSFETLAFRDKLGLTPPELETRLLAWLADRK